MVRKQLGVFALVMINVIAVDSLRSLPFSATYGFSLVFYYILAGLVFFLPVSLISAELATGWPSKGGVYVWVREAFGELWGFVIIWLQWVYNVVWYPTILAFMAGALAYLINPQLAENKFYMLSVILVIFWGATLINCFGMRLSSWVSTIGALVGTLVPMLFIIILGGMWIFQSHPVQIAFTSRDFFPDLTDVNHLSFLLAILFGLVGMELCATHADEVHNPAKSFPRAIIFSAVVIFLSLVLSSLAVAIVVPQNTLNVVTGLLQAFKIFFDSYHLYWMTPIITLLIVIGGIGGVATWVIGPTKGLLVATLDGSAPKAFGKVNRHGVPVIILMLQAVISSVLSLVFLLMPSVSSSYWVLTAITAQLAMLVYIVLFLAAIRLRYTKPEVHRAYKVGRGNGLMWVLAILGMLSSAGAILLGFIPPSQIGVGSIFKYEMLLVVGIILLCLPPWIIYRWAKKGT
ncbi:MAG: amino acid permease [Gammaproteobacteria bacterium]